MNVLVIGRGSIGRKHLKTLKDLSKRYRLSVHTFRPVSHGAGYYRELERVLKARSVDAAFVCNPTSMHAMTALACLRANAHVFLEKPLCDTRSIKTATRVKALLAKKHLTFMVGYDMRFNPWLIKVKELLEEDAIGDVWGARVMAGQYLPDWHPGTDYRKSYSARKDLGGGVLLDLSHEIDYLHWLLPKKVRSVTARLVNTGNLSIETEDIASIMLEYSDRSLAHIHLDYLTVPYRRSLELYGTKGSVIWDDNARTLNVYMKKAGRWKTLRVRAKAGSAATIFKNELAHFFECIAHKRTPLNSLENSIYVMRLAARALESSVKRKTVKF